MRVRGSLLNVLFALIAAAALLPLRASAQEAKDDGKDAPFSRVEFQGTPSPRGRIESLALVSAKDAELVVAKEKAGAASASATPPSAETVRGTWSLVRGPIVRFVPPDRVVKWFEVGKGGVTDSDSEQRLSVRAGATWHAAALADEKLRGDPERFDSPGGEMLFVHSDGSVDWKAPLERMKALERERVLDGKPVDESTLVLKMPDGARRVLVGADTADAKGWKDKDTATPFAPYTPTKPKPNDRQARLTCMNNLSQLAQLYVIRTLEKPGRPPYDGTALFLSWRKKKTMIQGGKEEVLRCPGDPDLRPLDEECRRAYDDVDFANPPDDLCSYAVRDFTNFPIRPEWDDLEVIACCRQGKDGKTPHHAGGIVVALIDGQTKFFTNAELGVPPGETIVIGPELTIPMLRVLMQFPPKKK